MIRRFDPADDDEEAAPPAGGPARDDEPDAGPGEEDALGHGARAGLDDTYVATCPFCFEACELVVDLGGGADQSYVEDCPVCCRPWQVRVTVDDEGAVTLDLEPLDE